jgi:putative ABC transport system permease protein
MFVNYFKIAFRHHRQHKLYMLINVCGLALGITAMLLAVLYLKDEHSFDTFHANNPHLYRVTTTVTPADKIPQLSGNTGQLQGPVFKAQVPEIVDYSRVMGGDIYGDIIANNKVLKQQLLFADESFFRVFSFPLIKGDPATALHDIGSVVITESTALKYFNRTDVVGQLLRMDADPSARTLGKPLVISGVVKDPPLHSSVQFDVLLSFRFLQLSFNDDDWFNTYLSTFVVLRPDAPLATVTAKLNRIQSSYAAAGKSTMVFGLQPVTDIHLHPLYNAEGSREGGVINGSNPVFSYIFLGIALFILLMAGINFINITLAGSLKRIKEVGVRKVNGSSSSQIIAQFLVESALLCALAFGLALLLTTAALPLFNTLAGKAITFSAIFNGELLMYGGALLSVIVLLTGAYPAYVLADYSALQAFSGKQHVFGRQVLGRVLMVTQFSLAVFFMIVTLLFYRQMDYVRTKDLGYRPQQVVLTHISGARDLHPIQALLKNELSNEPGISVLSFGGERGGASNVQLPGKQIAAVHRVIDNNYLSAMGISLKEGENFTTALSTGAIVNEAFVKAASLKNPIGTSIHTDEYFDKQPRIITGVVKDFHTGSLRERIMPLVMIQHPTYGGSVWLKLDKNRQPATLAALAAAYKKALPETAFTYQFLDELNAREYAQEQRWKKIIYIAALLSIVICCSGLFGLAHIATQQRMREIGIRKILGATMSNMVVLFSKDFMKLVLIAFLLASPLAWGVMHSWLQGFAYRVNMSSWIFMLAGCFAIGLTLATVAVQVVRAVAANPMKNINAG